MYFIFGMLVVILQVRSGAVLIGDDRRHSGSKHRLRRFND